MNCNAGIDIKNISKANELIDKNFLLFVFLKLCQKRCVMDTITATIADAAANPGLLVRALKSDKYIALANLELISVIW